MYGIAVGNRNAPEVILDGLKRLEYRGYDSITSPSSGGVTSTGRATSPRA